MNAVTAGRPDPSEYTPYYSAYVAQVDTDDIVSALRGQLDELLGFVGHLDPVTADHRYAAGKWSVKEVIGHVVDSERIFGYRALAIARGERRTLPGFEQDDYVAEGEFTRRSLQSLADEFDHVRRSNLALFESLSADQWMRIGEANEAPISVRAIAWILVGHAKHHVAVIRERYLGTA